MTVQPRIAILFLSSDAANSLVAGLPAAVRALAYATEHFGAARIIVAVPGGWKPSAYCVEEASRLAPDVDWRAADTRELGEAATRWNGASIQLGDPCAIADPKMLQSISEGNTALKAASRRIIKATRKSADGIVSRYINRTLSQAMTGWVLRFGWSRPGHATALAAIIGLLMLGLLVMGGECGLLAGAILFQCASIVDGVDGEMARATRRSSMHGAMLDSLTDTATNLGFLIGVSFNIWQQGNVAVAQAGLLTVIVLAAGSFLLARAAQQSGGPLTFDALKNRFRERPSPIKQALTYLTMRDFYALASCLAVLAGYAEMLLIVFAIVACGWFTVVCFSFMSNRLGCGNA